MAKSLHLGRRIFALKKYSGNPIFKFGPTKSSSVSYTTVNDRIELDYYELMDLVSYDECLALIDVRTPQELEKYGSIPGAVNIPLNNIKSALQLSSEEFRREFFLSKPGKDAENLIFFARGPNASSAALEIAHKLGFKKSRQYSGGWEDYCSKTGLPLSKFQVGRQNQVQELDLHHLC